MIAATQTKPGAGYEISIVRTFKAPRELVFDCFTDPAHMAAWWEGPAGLQERSAVHILDARPGGEEFRSRWSAMATITGWAGEFIEIDRPNRLVFLSKAFEAPDGGWGIVNRNTLTFEDVCDGFTRLTLHTLVERAQGELVLGALSGMKVGWGQSLEKLGDLVGGGGKMDVEVGDRRLILTRAFDASPERVWQALTDPKDFVRWWTGGGKVESFDVRPGGQWSLRQTNADGAEHRFWGEFRQVEPPTRLVMTQGFDAYPAIDVEVTLTRDWGRTTLTRVMTFPNNEYRDGLIGSGVELGAADSYDRLAKVVSEAALGYGS